MSEPAGPGDPPRERSRWALFDLLAAQRRFVYLAVTVLSAAGVWSALRLPSAIYPELTFPKITIVASGASLAARQMVFAVARPIEEAVSIVPGVTRVRSRSIRGAVEMPITFAENTDMPYALQLVRTRVEQIRGDLPAGMQIMPYYACDCPRGHKGKWTNKKTQKSVAPAGLGDAPPKLSPDDDPREALVDWMTAKDNRFFARALVNRYWKHFFNRGLVDPEDDMRETNPATNPQLLAAAARHFADEGYDLKNLVRTICRSRVYQLSSIPNEFNRVDRQYFSRYYPKRLTAEVLFDAVNQVTQADGKFDGLPAGTRAVQLPDNSFNANSYFLTVFGRPESSSSCECERSQDASLAQSLHLLNAKEIQDKLASEQGRAAQLAKDQQRPDDAKLRELYQWAYAREPVADELQFARGYLEKKTGQAGDEPAKQCARRQAYEDTIWALLSTKEFLFNH